MTSYICRGSFVIQRILLISVVSQAASRYIEPMKILFRLLTVIAMIVATLFTLGYIAGIVGLWMSNAPAQSMLTGALTVSDEFLLNADQVIEKTDVVLVNVIRLGQEIDVTIEDIQQEQNEDAQFLQPVQRATTSINQIVTQLSHNLEELRASAQATEQTVSRLIPRIPVYVNLAWIGVTLFLLWLALAQVALFYLALLYLRTGSLGWTKQAKISVADDKKVDID